MTTQQIAAAIGERKREKDGPLDSTMAGHLSLPSRVWWARRFAPLPTLRLT
jgi:hypothetical protein